MKNRSFTISCLAVAAGLLLFACSKADTADPIESTTGGGTSEVPEILDGEGSVTALDPKLSKQSLTFPKEGGTEAITAEKNFNLLWGRCLCITINGEAKMVCAGSEKEMSVWLYMGAVYDPTIKFSIIPMVTYEAVPVVRIKASEVGKKSTTAPKEFWVLIEDMSKRIESLEELYNMGAEGYTSVFLTRIEGDWFTIERSFDDLYAPVDRSVIGSTLEAASDGAKLKYISSVAYADQLYRGGSEGKFRTTVTVKPNTTGVARTLRIDTYVLDYSYPVEISQE